MHFMLCYKWNKSPGVMRMRGLSRQQVLVLTLLLFFSVVILGCLVMLTIPSPTTGSPAFVF
jgi:hypothetical protein